MRTKQSNEVVVSGLPINGFSGWSQCNLIGNLFPAPGTGCGGSRIIAGIFLCHPFDESLDVFMAAQRIPGVIALQQLPLAECRVDFAMTDAMDRVLFLALECLGNKMMTVDIDIAQHASAKRT